MHNPASNTDVRISNNQNRRREDPAKLPKRQYGSDPHTPAVHHKPKYLPNEHDHTEPNPSPVSADRSEGASPIPSDVIADANKVLPRGIEGLGLTLQDKESLKVAKKEMEMVTYLTYPADQITDGLAHECWKRAVSRGRGESGISRPRNKVLGHVGLLLPIL